MNIEQIRTFLEIAENGNFNRTAENLNVTQSTVSARIRTLEDLLGRTLFVRSHSGAQLTSAGQRFRRYALNMQRLWHLVYLPFSFADLEGVPLYSNGIV